MKKILFLLLALPGIVLASEGVSLDRAPLNVSDNESLQRGARIFVNYCLSCHSANYMRYNRLQDIGLTEKQIKDNLVFAANKPGETMYTAMRMNEAKAWFGITPPDLTVTTRARGANWVYSYLRSFYRDNGRPTGWNNLVYANAAMPHALHELQGQMEPVTHTEKTPEGRDHVVIDRLELVKPGKLTLAEYDAAVGDLVNYMAWMAEPAQSTRKSVGLAVLLFLGLFYIVAFYLKREFWKDVH